MGAALILAHLIQLGMVGLEAYQLVAAYNSGDVDDRELQARWTAMQKRLRAASDTIQAP